MLAVQKFLLEGRSHSDLTAELGIRVTAHATLPLVILNYDQCDSPKTHPIVRECRGLVLNRETHELAARAFPRFFNWGEVVQEMALFDFLDFAVQTKEDGSLVLIYRFAGQWRINTRGSFAQEKLAYQPFSWEEGVLQAMGLSSRADLDRVLPEDVTYVAEFCSPWNKVVRRYERPAIYLLTAFRGIHELTHAECDGLAHEAGVFRRPQRHDFKRLDEVQEFLADQAAADPTFEGVVMRDRHNHRWKIKSPTYLGMHQLQGEEFNCWNPKHFLPFILTGETDELLTYYPQVRETYLRHEARVREAYAALEAAWRASQGIASQKDFALAIRGKTPFTGLLFQLRKEHGPHAPHDALKKLWRNSAEAILKAVFKDAMRSRP